MERTFISNIALWDVFPDHMMLLAGLDFPFRNDYEWQWRLPGHIAWDKLDTEKWASVQSQTQWGPTGFSLEGGADLFPVPGRLDLGSLSSFDSTQAFAVWSSAFENRVAASMSDPVAAVDRSFVGRGQTWAPKRRRKCAPVLKRSRQGELAQASGLLNRAVGRWFRQLRLQSYRRAALSDRFDDTYHSELPCGIPF